VQAAGELSTVVVVVVVVGFGAIVDVPSVPCPEPVVLVVISVADSVARVSDTAGVEEAWPSVWAVSSLATGTCVPGSPLGDAPLDAEVVSTPMRPSMAKRNLPDAPRDRRSTPTKNQRMASFLLCRQNHLIDMAALRLIGLLLQVDPAVRVALRRS
jgi:hypothetical protein